MAHKLLAQLEPKVRREGQLNISNIATANMRSFLSIITVLFVVSYLSTAAPLSYPDHNCTIEFPETWRKLASPSPQVLAMAQSPDGLKTFVLMAMLLSKDEQSMTIMDAVADSKKRAIEQGCQIIGEIQLPLVGLSFEGFVSTRSDGASMAAYCASVGEHLYMLQSISKAGDATIDAELQSVIASFRLLSPVRSLSEVNKPRSTAYRAGYVWGRLLMVGLIGAGAALLVRWFVKRRGVDVSLSSSAKPKRPASVITSTVLLGFLSFVGVVWIRIAMQNNVFSFLYLGQAGLFIAAFGCSLFYARAHTTYYLVTAALALWVIKSVMLTASPQLNVPPMSPNSPVARAAAILMTVAVGLLFWRYTFGKPSREFYGLKPS